MRPAFRSRKTFPAVAAPRRDINQEAGEVDEGGKANQETRNSGSQEDRKGRDIALITGRILATGCTLR